MNLIQQAEQFVTRLLQEQLPSTFLYHNFNHTVGVVKAVTSIAKYQQISDEDTEKLLLAAWFHDTGYIKGVQNHEVASVAILESFLEQQAGKEVLFKPLSLLVISQKNSGAKVG